jgi:hypothetical protein
VLGACLALAALACSADPGEASEGVVETTTGGQGGDPNDGPRVRLVYLVPPDRSVVPLYAATLEKALRELSLWYQDHTADGSTFEMHDPVVEVVATPHPAAWYATHPTSGSYLHQFWDNARADAFALTGGAFSDPANIWVYYLDADYACGQMGGAGTSGVTILPANDLRGLAGERNHPPCPEDPIDTSSRCRWVGGLGHELGHAFGLPHPPGCDNPNPATPCDHGALMWTGYTTYPDTRLTNADRAQLAASPFFAPRDLPAGGFDCSEP